MRRALVSLFLSLLLLLSFCACESYTAPQNPLFYESEPFTVTADGTVNGQAVQLQITRSEEGTFEICYSSDKWQNLIALVPKSYLQSGITLCYDGMEVPISCGTSYASVCAIVKLFSFLQSEMSACRLAQNDLDTEVVFSCEDGSATLLLDQENGYPKSAQAQLYHLSLSLTFSSFTPMQKGQ